MLDQKALEELAPAVRVSQIIVLAMTLAVTLFAGFAVVTGRAPDQPGNNLLTYLSLGFAALEGVLCVVVPRIMVASSRRNITQGTWKPQEGMPKPPATDEGKLTATYQTSLIVGCALLEGAAFFTCFAYLAERQIMALATTGLLVLGILLHFPTLHGVADWIEIQLRQIQDDRPRGG